ncbi:unnamed protein product, partial [marine sediment metagenome]
YNPDSPDYFNAFDLDYANLKFYTRKSSRNLDGGEVFKFGSITISTHIKSTVHNTIITASKRAKNYALLKHLEKKLRW